MIMQYSFQNAGAKYNVVSFIEFPALDPNFFFASQWIRKSAISKKSVHPLHNNVLLNSTGWVRKRAYDACNKNMAISNFC